MAKMDKDADKKSMDVSKPGKSMPDLSARPVIVTHRPMVQDPMVKSEAKSEEPVEPVKQESDADTNEESVPSYEKKVIKPISEPEPAESDGSAADEAKEDTTKETDEPASDDAAVVEAVASQAQSRAGKKDGEPSEQDKANQEHIKKLIADKTYFVSVGQATRRRNRRTAVMFLVFLVLVLAGAYAAVDAGIIAANIELPIDLIKN
jgi:hypothetical protein